MNKNKMLFMVKFFLFVLFFEFYSQNYKRKKKKKKRLIGWLARSFVAKTSIYQLLSIIMALEHKECAQLFS